LSEKNVIDGAEYGIGEFRKTLIFVIYVIKIIIWNKNKACEFISNKVCYDK